MIRKFSFALVALLVAPVVASAATFTQQLDYTGLENKLISQTFHAVVRTSSSGTSSVVSPAFLQNGDVIVTLYQVQSLLVNNVAKSFTDGAVLYSVVKFKNPGGALVTTTDPYNKIGGNVLGLFNPSTLTSISGNVSNDIAANIGSNSALLLGSIPDSNTDYIVMAPNSGIPSPVIKFFNLSQTGGSLQTATDATNGTDMGGYDVNVLAGVGEWFSSGTSTVTFALVPEPGTIALWGAGLAIGAVVAFRRRKQD